MTVKKLRKQKKWRVYSERTGRNMGTYTTKAAAEKRLGQIEYFKRRKRRR